ncbi:MAG TPA: CpsB/CapC family capsule biosynthesis tyrosine phosphatase [Thermoanaerobaculia bacterium]|nr:CpsB/CapC family capsule biosynthesis tyrosine phosphatase [Thermoanaerobaculia bacterium]
MIDLHCHILPGVDDGAIDFDEAVAMCRLAAARGCEEMVATPHQRHPRWWNDDRARLERVVRELQSRVGPSPRLHLGAEIRLCSGLLEEVEALPGGSLLPLAGSRYLLLELDSAGLGPDPFEIVHEVSVAGWQPIIAHPELYPWLVGEPGLAERLVELGARLQVTGMSLTGGFGRRAQAACRELIDGGLVAFVASDAHGLVTRPPGLAQAYTLLAASWGEEVAQALTRSNAAAVIANRPLPLAA